MAGCFFVLCFFIFCGAAKGACVYKGSLYEVDSSWTPRSCLQCSCLSDVVICRNVVCSNPQCDFSRGERLQIPSNQCCPQCISSSESCDYEGVTYGDESQWNPSPCSVCRCSRGRVACSGASCPPLACPDGHRALTSDGECCPHCVSDGVSCSYQGSIYSSGDQWDPSNCSRCFCNHGNVQCSVVQCSPVACKQNQNLLIRSGQCCPQCVSDPCLSAGNQYQHGEQWQKNPCTTCVCDHGQSKCHTHVCPPVSCEQGQTKVKHQGQCCEECAAAKGSCLYKGSVYHHGNMWSSTQCEFCSCNLGHVTCQSADCGVTTCSQGSELVHLPDQCCPQCLPPQSSCTHHHNHYQNKAQWSDDSCRQCECRDGHVTCFLTSCPTCPLGTLSVPQPGQCCPTCLHVGCHSDCLRCVGSSDQCESCRDSTSVLHQGQCLSVCPHGFYSDGQTCKACHPSCSTCSSGSECTSCSNLITLLSPDGGTCVSSCPPGSYQHNVTHCLRCDKSCAECHGPADHHCVSCDNPGALIKDGSCVHQCGRGFYSEKGTCYACHSSCLTCFDDSNCLSCPPGHALHHGKCLSHCPPHHYSDHHSRCRACHSSCVSCSGPSVSQCSSCSHTHSLYQNQCVESCGGGLYSLGGACHSCHPTCRSCVGPSPSDCTACWKPEEVLVLQSDQLHHGVCADQCSTHTFIDQHQSCKECHPSCSSCVGPSSVNCTSCLPPLRLSESVCVSVCPQGFYNNNNNNMCHLCHPSCQECSGPSESDCSSCPPLADLHSGNCRTRCQQGQFFSSVHGECLSCSPDCQRCTTDLQSGVGSICVLCKDERKWLLGDHCISKCPDGYYGRHGACSRCHPSCGGCGGSGPLSCTSCPPLMLLLPSNMCSPVCPPGYYDNAHRICQKCDDQCLTCSTSGSCTSCRDPNKVLMFGECQYDVCAHQYYLNTSTRTCKECSWTCNSCRGPLRTDCVHCMDGYVLEVGGACSQSCSMGSYQDGEQCISCDDHCLQCSGPGVCVQCEPPYVSLRGVCVMECGRNYFLDASSNVCKSCSADCVLCEGTTGCKACNEHMFLRDGLCSRDCGPGFYTDHHTKTCSVNSHPPSLQVVGSLMVPVGGFHPLLPPLLQVEDQDSPPENLVLQLLQTPSNGQLVLFRQGEEPWRWGRGQAGHNLSSSSNFTWTEMKQGRVQFRHLPHKPRSGHFSVRAADPQLVSEPKLIQVQVVSFQAPQVLTLAPLRVENIGGSTTITKSVLNIEDRDNPSEVLILVFEEPQHGRLTRLHSERVVTQFKLEELIREQIQYVHDGSKGTQDRTVLQVNDGYNYQNVLLEVHIRHPQENSVQMTLSPKTWVKEGGMVQLNRKFLKASYRGVDSDDIVYTLIDPSGLPQHGELILMSMPADSPPEDWPPALVDNRGFTPTTSFSQQDVNDGSVWYRHYGPGTSSDTFSFQASTDVEPVVQSQSQTFTIGILPQTPGFPQMAPHSDLQITALEDRVTEITSDALSFFDSETPDDKLVYNITKALLTRQGSIEHRDRPYSPVKRFTQHDVNHGRIIYRPPQAPPHLQELYQYSFIGLPESLSVFFTVSDGEHTTPEMDFVVLLLSNHQQPPVFQVLDPVLEVRYGGKASIGGSQLAVSDADTSPDELEFELVESPVHGELMRTDSHTNTLITNGDTFTFSDITHSVLVYHHAGLSTQDDLITFTVSDGISMATTVVQVVVLGSENRGPQKDPTASLTLTAAEKSSSIIRRSHMAYSDDVSRDDQIVVQLVSGPMYGSLINAGTGTEEDLKDYSSFTMEDINQHRIRYITSIETGSQPITDVFHFVVHDGDKNRLDNQMFTITITSTPRPLPLVTVRNGIKVHEGGRVQLSTNHIMVSDVETPRTELLIWLVSPPRYGFIENTQKGGLFGSSKVVTPEEPFSVDDLTSGHVFYVQDRQREPNPQQDLFSLHISDGQRHTEAFTVEIDIQQSVEDSEPVVSVSIINVEENSGVIITNSSLSIHDNDTPDSEILFTITKVPTNGKLRRRQFQSQPLEKGRVLTLGHTFTYQDVIDQLMVYTPKAGPAPHREDEVGFTITDGIYTHSAHLEFTIDPRRGEGPRVTINRGLQLLSGTSSKITDQNLKATDTDSDSNRLQYFITTDPPVGKILLSHDGHVEKVSAQGPTHTFYQEDINKGLLQYSHDKTEKGGSVSLTFDLVDPEGNKLIQQSFFISVLEDHLPPSVVVNKGLVLNENSMKKLTTLQLSSTDSDSEPGELVYTIITPPLLGHLEHSHSPGTRISSFTQADLVSRHVHYVHSSEEETHADHFTFSVSDGTNQVSQTFYITINPVDDSLPLLSVPGMRVQEGVRKTISEFEMKATDRDTQAESIVFSVVQPPRHGAIERSLNGVHYRQTQSFSMEDVYQNRISYSHDGSNSLTDRFSFTVSDGTNALFMVEEGGKEVITAAPQTFQMQILPVDDGTPRIVTNLGLQWLEYMDNKATNLITKKELQTIDPDTEDEHLVYEVTSDPKHGTLENNLRPGSSISSFTQAEVNLGLIRYVLYQENVLETMDHFKFLVRDTKPHLVTDNVFHIQWSIISFEHKSYNVSEQSSTVAVTVKRSGNLNQYAIVLCRTEPGSASSSSSGSGSASSSSSGSGSASSSSSGSGPQNNQQDYVEYAGQVQFDEREDSKVCSILINDDGVFEGSESFSVELSVPVYALLGQNTRAVVFINDTEDEPTLQFDQKTHHVNESSGFIHVPVERTGDPSQTVSALCSTESRSAQGSGLHTLQSGSDYKSRGKTSANRVIFGPGVTMTTCDVTLIDDSEYELSEEFHVVLSDASDNARMGEVTAAKVVIDGPNDASTLSLGNATYSVSEDSGSVEIVVVRHGSDLSSSTSVWCATQPSDPPSASPLIDYVPSSRKIEFKSGQTEETCTLTIIDDIQNPVIEGAESFIVFLSSPQGAVLQEPHEATVTITDTFLDIPSMQFTKAEYTVKENMGSIDIPIHRHGDLSLESSVRCFTRTMSALVTDDYRERRNIDQSRITFLKGEKVKNCSVAIVDDSVFESEEAFQVHLGAPLGEHWSGAMTGHMDVVTVTINNDEDAPTIGFEQASYQVREPPGPDGVEVLTIKVLRTGDLDQTSKVRCSTRDGSAQSGVDYNPRSRVLKFSPGLDHILFKVEILSNEDTEWHESFSVVLGPDDPVEAVLGDITVATVTILDQEAAGSLILPVPPVVVSLADYDHVTEVTKEGSKRSPSPGYPVVCVTPCDPHSPHYAVMRERCEEAGINLTMIHFSWEVSAPTDSSGARSPLETVTDATPFTSVNHMVLDSIYFSRRFHVRCVAQAKDKVGHLGTPLRSPIVTIGTDGSICHTPVSTGSTRGFQAQSFIARLKYLDVKQKDHPNSIHVSVQIPHQDGMLPLISTMPLHNLHFLLSESIYRQQHVCSNLVNMKDLQGLSGCGFLDDVSYDSIPLGPGYDRAYQFNPLVRETRTIQLYKHLNLKSCIWTFDAYYDMTELIDVCGGSVTADFQVRDSSQSFLTVQVPLYVSYIYVTAPRGWASLEHHTEMEFSFFYDTVLWRTGIQTDSVLSAKLQIIRISIREDGRLVIEFKTHAKFRGQFVLDHHTLPGHQSHLLAPEHLGGLEFNTQLIWSAHTFDSPYQLWRATSSYSRKDYSGEYVAFLIPCTVQPTQPWTDPGDKALSCTAHAPEKFLVPISFQQTHRPVPVVYSLNTEFQLCNNEEVFIIDPAAASISTAELDYRGAFSMGQTLYGRVFWNPDQNLKAAYQLQLEKVYLCTGRDGYVPYFDPTGTLYNEGPQYGCIQPNRNLKHRFLLLDRKQPDVCHKFFHDVPFEAHFASDVPQLRSMVSMPGVDGFTMKVDALYKVEAGHQWYLQVIYVISPESGSSPRIQRSIINESNRSKRDLIDQSGRIPLDESLIYDNEGDQVKNGTNMKALQLEAGPLATFQPHVGTSVGGGVASVAVVVLVLLGSAFLWRRCRTAAKRPPKAYEDYPLNTKVHVCVEKNFSTTNVNTFSRHSNAKAKVKQVNLEVKVHNNLSDGTEV